MFRLEDPKSGNQALLRVQPGRFFPSHGTGQFEQSYTPPGVPIWHARSEIGYPFLRCLVYILVRKIRFALSVLARLANCVSPGQVFVIRGEFLLHRFISSRLRGIMGYREGDASFGTAIAAHPGTAVHFNPILKEHKG